MLIINDDINFLIYIIFPMQKFVLVVLYFMTNEISIIKYIFHHLITNSRKDGLVSNIQIKNF